MKAQHILLFGVFFLLAIGAAFVACGDDDDDDDTIIVDDDDDSGDDAGDDDDTGDDDNDDSSDDDDDNNDDSSFDNPPILSNGFWNPSEMAVGYFSDIGYAWYSTLTWSVCDLDNDLAGGQVFIYFSGTNDSAITGNVFWSDFGNLNAGDCTNPVQVEENIRFALEENPPAQGWYCDDIQATDGHGNLSNRLSNLCVYKN